MNKRFGGLFSAIDKKDSAGFAKFLSENASFRFANQPAVSGRANIEKFVAGFFSAIKALEHDIQNIWETDGVVISAGEVTYTRLDGKVMTFPFANILRMDGELISDYKIYIDNSQLFI